MKEREMVCIRCHTGGELVSLGVHDNGTEVGLVYSCKDCFDTLRRSTLDLFVGPVNENVVIRKQNS
ncbi:MAG: hypothetical protein WBI10_03950 [Syntrophales bacterium]